MPVRSLPENPSLTQLKHQAKDLLRIHAARLAETAQLIREFHPRFHRSTDQVIFAAKLRLSDAQFIVARRCGFASWTALKRRVEKPSLADQLDRPHHERIEDDLFRHAVALVDKGDTAELRALLTKNPKLVRQRILFEGGNYFHSPTLLEFVAENPVRHGSLSKNIVEVARIILEARPEQSARDATLGLVATGRVTRECKVQIPLIDLLCDQGAEPNCAIRAATAHNEFAAVHALLRRGATMDLPIAAALGLMPEFLRLFAAAGVHDRHLALAFSAQFGHVEIVRHLLDAGEDPDRYNPLEAHSHATPLHQAAIGGHASVVQLLVERGAPLDRKDVLWHATPREWAEHERKTSIASFLRAKENEAREN